MGMMLIPILKGDVAEKDSKLAPAKKSKVKFELPAESKNMKQFFPGEIESSGLLKRDYIVKAIFSKETTDSDLLRLINEFKDNILFLEKSNNVIVKGLLKLQWYSKNDQFVSSFQDLVLNLVTAHPIYLPEVFTMIGDCFINISGNAESYTDADCLCLKHVHTLSERISRLIPLSQTSFCAVLGEMFPYIKMQSSIILHYVENLLVVCSYMPKKRPVILASIIDKLIQIDVICSKDAIEFYEKENEAQIMEIGNSANGDTNTEEKMVMPLAHTLDIVLSSMFKYIHKICYVQDGKDLNWEACKKLYKELLTIFDKIILPTHSSCHVQYLMFHICSFKKDLSEGFLDYLWKKVQNPSVGLVFRQMAAFYIGSYLARALYINIDTVTECFNLMCSWIHRYIDAHTSQDLEVHGTFHSVCQAVFYVFAFRNKELMDMPKSYTYLRGLQLDRVASCRLNPLRFIDPGIAHNFASASRAQQIAYVYPIIERNQRNLLGVSDSIVPTFFPFDPYLLKRSKVYIDSLYRVYNHSAKESDCSEPMEEDRAVEEDLFSYSTSPGFKKNWFSKLSRA